MNFLLKYWQLFKIAWQVNYQSWGSIFGRFGFYALILFVFSQLWKVALASRMVQSFSADQMIWYLAITEWIILSLPLIHLEIENEIRSGDIAYQLGLPLQYIAGKFSQGMGTVLFRLLGLGIGGFILASLLTESGVFSISRIIFIVIPLGIAASSLALLFQIMIGLSAFWLHDTSPAAWIWQKLIFFLGGLILPLDLYPQWLQSIAQLLPFSAILYGPGLASIQFDPWLIGITWFKLILWFILSIILVRAIFARALRILEVNGG